MVAGCHPFNTYVLINWYSGGSSCYGDDPTCRGVSVLRREAFMLKISEAEWQSLLSSSDNPGAILIKLIDYVPEEITEQMDQDQNEE